jgi:hypothetical protein
LAEPLEQLVAELCREQDDEQVEQDAGEVTLGRRGERHVHAGSVSAGYVGGFPPLAS